MEFKGTKGKWSTELSFDEKYFQSVININSGDSIKSLATVWSGSNENCSQTKYDAKLIASAPEMLEMLKIAKEKLLRVESPITSCRRLANEIDELIKKATE